MAGFVKVGRTEDVSAGKTKKIDVSGKTVALFNVGGDYYAIDDRCPHVGGSLSGGSVAGKIVTCPWHGATFELTSGKVLGGPAPSGVGCYNVRLAGDEIEIEV